MNMQCATIAVPRTRSQIPQFCRREKSHARAVGRRTTAAWTLAACATCFAPSHAQDTGSVSPQLPKQIRIITASVGGTGPDFLARLLAPRMSEGLRVSVIVENRPSANGLVAAQYTARATPDGSVMMMGNAGTHGVNGALYKSPGYDPVQDFAHISELASIPLALVIHPSVPAKNLPELITLARRAPGKLNVAVAGAAGELMGNSLKVQAKIDMTNIHYKGGAVATIAVLSGEADMVFTSFLVVGKHVEAGRLRVMGVTSRERMPQYPDVPTIAEGGLPGYEQEQWYGLFAPAKTPAAIVQVLHDEAARIVRLPDVSERLVSSGHRIVAGTSQQLAERVRREVENTRQIMRDSGMQQQ